MTAMVMPAAVVVVSSIVVVAMAMRVRTISASVRRAIRRSVVVEANAWVVAISVAVATVRPTDVDTDTSATVARAVASVSTTVVSVAAVRTRLSRYGRLTNHAKCCYGRDRERDVTENAKSFGFGH